MTVNAIWNRFRYRTLHIHGQTEHNWIPKQSEQLRVALEQCQRELQECRKRAARAETLFANVADTVIVAEADGQIVDANPTACEVLGYSKEELLEMHPWDFVTSASREEILELIREMRPGAPVTVQRTYRSKNGELKIMDLRLGRCDVAGNDLIIVSCRDVTERQLLEARLRRSEKNLAEGQRLTKTGSWVLDFKTGNTDWSVETCRIPIFEAWLHLFFCSRGISRHPSAGIAARCRAGVRR